MLSSPSVKPKLLPALQILMIKILCQPCGLCDDIRLTCQATCPMLTLTKVLGRVRNANQKNVRTEYGTSTGTKSLQCRI